MKNTNIKITLNRILVLVVLLTSNIMLADDPPPFVDDVEDVPAPIDTNLIYLGLIAIVLAFYMIKRFSTKKVNQ